MSTLTTMKFDSLCIMYEHVIEMKNTTTKLKSLGMELVQFIILSEYAHFQMNYNAMKDKWNVYECTEFWFRRNQGTYSINLVGHQGAGKMKGSMLRENIGTIMLVSPLIEYVRRNTKVIKCYLYEKFGHFQKDCLKRKAWFEKKNVSHALLRVSNQI